MTSPFYWLNKLADAWNPDHDIFPNTPIQANYVDGYLIELCKAQQEHIDALETRLTKLEIFTGMVAPEPLAAANSHAPEAETDRPPWNEPTPEEVARFWGDEIADERADVIREVRYGKQL